MNLTPKLGSKLSSKFSAPQLLLAIFALSAPLPGCGQDAGSPNASAGSSNAVAGATVTAGSSSSSAAGAGLAAGGSSAGADSSAGSGGSVTDSGGGAPEPSGGSAAGGAVGNAGSGPSTVTTGVQMDGPLTMVDATQVKLAKGSPFYDRQDLHRTGFVASLDPDKLLFPFRKIAGLPQAAGVSAGYAGWDSTTLKGHIGGHYLSGASRLAAATGDTSFASKVNYMVTELGKCQDAIKTGYIAGFAEGDSQVGAPYYVHHKVMAGLVDAYRYLGNQQALDIAVKMSTYLSKRLANTNYAGNSELGAMTDVLTEIYSLTKDDAHIKLAPKFEPTDFITPLASNQDQLKGQHANMHIAFLVGGARYANVTGDATETAASANFWSIVTGKHSYVHGGNSVHEWFQGPNVEAAQLPFSTGEECNSNNMLKLTARLIEHNQQPAQGDYFERTLVNHILSSLAPDTGRGTYFMPLHGGFRTYLDSTYCCMGTGIENTGRYNEGIYFKGSKLLLVNLYIPSEVTWSEQGLSLKQEGYLPTTDTVTLTVTKATAPTAATIQFRIPNWVSGAVGLTINGEAQTVDAKPSSDLSINRTWQAGDVVKLKLPAALRIERARDQNNMVSIFYGPVLLAGKLGTSGMPSNDQAADKEAYSKIADTSVPDIVNASASPASWLTLTDLPTLTFKAQSSAGPAAGVTFQPLYAVHHERYSVYFNLRAN